MNCQQKSRFSLFSKGVQKRRPQKAPKRAPREANMSPRSGSGGPKSGPRGPKSALRGARSAPRGAQEQPGAPQEGTKRAPREAFPPRGLQEPFGRPAGPILASFWGARGFIFKNSRRPFRSSRALRQTIENTVRNHWSKGLVSVWLEVCPNVGNPSSKV